MWAMSKQTQPLFRFDLFRVSPEKYDAHCRRIETRLKESGVYNHLDFASRQEAIVKAAQKEYPWKAQRCGWVQVELEGSSFVATLHLADDAGPSIVEKALPTAERERYELATLTEEPEAIREALYGVAKWADRAVPASVYVDSDHYEMLVERFDLKRFRADFLLRAPGHHPVERPRYWN